jgi:hypothetical protein
VCQRVEGLCGEVDVLNQFALSLLWLCQVDEGHNTVERLPVSLLNGLGARYICH